MTFIRVISPLPRDITPLTRIFTPLARVITPSVDVNNTIRIIMPLFAL